MASPCYGVSLIHKQCKTVKEFPLLLAHTQPPSTFQTFRNLHGKFALGVHSDFSLALFKCHRSSGVESSGGDSAWIKSDPQSAFKIAKCHQEPKLSATIGYRRKAFSQEFYEFIYCSLFLQFFMSLKVWLLQFILFDLLLVTAGVIANCVPLHPTARSSSFQIFWLMVLPLVQNILY